MTAAAEKTTPGPWETDKNRGWIYHRPDALTQFVIAVMETGTEGDAALIAAAPDLLEALKGVLRIADRSTAEFDAARAAISKASSPA